MAGKQEKQGSEAESALFRWIENHGGYVNPSLSVVPEAPCGARGVVATTFIAAEEPLFVVPEHLYITNQDSVRLLGPLFQSSSRVPNIESLAPSLQLAVLLAKERKKGTASRWYPYIHALPETPPNVWFDRARDAAAVTDMCVSGFGFTGEQASVLSGEIERTNQELDAFHFLIDQHLSNLGLTIEDIRWAYGTVTSRAFGNDGGYVGLAPGIDMMNHRNDAGQPFPIRSKTPIWAALSVQLDANALPTIDPKRTPSPLDGTWPCACVIAEKGGEAVDLQAGQEAMISYVAEMKPTKAMLNFGFVPEPDEQ